MAGQHMASVHVTPIRYSSFVVFLIPPLRQVRRCLLSKFMFIMTFFKYFLYLSRFCFVFKKGLSTRQKTVHMLSAVVITLYCHIYIYFNFSYLGGWPCRLCLKKEFLPTILRLLTLWELWVVTYCVFIVGVLLPLFWF